MYPPAELSLVKRYSITRRPNRTRHQDFGKPLSGSLRSPDFLKALPRFLKANDFKDFIDSVANSRRKGLPFHLLLGAHTIKVGLSPVFIDLMQKEIVTGVSFNGAGLIHDLELAFFGGTSEDVLSGLRDGSFGMVEETGKMYGEVLQLANNENLGLGAACGKFIVTRKARYQKQSIFAQAWQLSLPATVHAGIGTDIVAQHPEFDGAKVGRASHLDFKVLCTVCKHIDKGGVVANIGSAVILPEVFLKALTVARNLSRGGKSRLTTANFDMLEHYRPTLNVVLRPTSGAGKGYNFIGHHELMIPLLAWCLRESV